MATAMADVPLSLRLGVSAESVTGTTEDGTTLGRINRFVEGVVYFGDHPEDDIGVLILHSRIDLLDQRNHRSRRALD